MARLTKKNYDPGVVVVTAPAGGVLSGDMVQDNALVGIAMSAAASGAACALEVEGVFEGPADGSTGATGDAVYCVSTGAEFGTGTNDAADYYVGKLVGALTAGQALAAFYLNAIHA
jgi:predicted RecA/RadA family phage recombinase